jgi:ABC-type sugar transport system substrate-binding protein/HAMP domain-containing protein
MNKRTVLTTRKMRTSFKDWPIAGKLLVLVLAPLGLTLATTLVLIFTSLNRLEVETSIEALQHDVSVIHQQFADVEAHLLQTADELTANPILLEAVQRDDRQALQGLLLSARIRSGWSYLEVVDARGQVVVTNRNFDLDETPPELKRLHKLGLLQITDAVELVPTPSGWLMATVRPIKLQSGEVFGALAIGRLLDNSFLATVNSKRISPILVVFDGAGNLINTSETEAESNLAKTFEVDRGLWAAAANGETLFNQGRVHGELQRVAYAPLVVKNDQTEAVFGLVLSTAQATGLRDQLVGTSLALAGVLGVLTILAVFFLGRSFIIRPVTALVSGAEQFAAGQLEVKVQGVSSRDEVGMLAQAFNRMTDQLRQTLLGLENRTRGLEIITRLTEHLTAILKLEELMDEVVNQIKNNFGYYHTQIYLLDETGQNLNLASATGQAGQKMLAQNHTIPLGRGLVGRAAQQKEVVLAPNLARMIAPEVVTAKNIDTVYQREVDPAYRRQWYHQYITRIFGGLEELAAGSKPATRRLKLGYVLADFGEFSVPIRQAAQDAAQDLDIDIEVTSPPHTDRPDQLVEAFEQHLAAGKDGLVIIPQFQSVWPPHFNRANQAGIPVVTANLTGPDVANWTWFGQDGYQGGFALAIEFKQILQAAGYQAGQIVVGISGTREAELVARYEGFKAGLAGTVFTCSDLFCSGTIEPETTRQLWLEFINAHPNLIAAAGLTAQAIPTLARIKTETQATWLIAGFDLETATLEALKTGLAQVTIAQHPYLQGYLPVLALVQYLRQGKPLSDWVVEGWLPNPLLPDTKAEISVPINLEDQVVGVLDVQADKVDSLDETDANILRSLANQVAVAIRNARQFAQVQAALAEAGELQRRYVEQSWDRSRVIRKNVSRVQFSLGESASLDEAFIHQAKQQALLSRKPTVVSFNGQQDDLLGQHALVAPIMLRDVVIGDLQLHEGDARREWTESELALITAVVDQVAQAAENLRLLDETQERASREQLISQISNKMRRAPDMESLLKVAVTELSRALNPARTFVRMDLPEVGQPVEVKPSEVVANSKPEQRPDTEAVTNSTM